MAKAKRPSMRDRIREQAHASTTEGASYLKLQKKMNFFQPKAEEYSIDILPFENTNPNHHLGYEEGELVPYVRFKIHNSIGAEDRKYICPTSIGKRCPICDERNRMAKSSNSDPDLIKALTPKDRTIFQLIDLGEEKKGVQIFEHSYHLFCKKLLADIDKSENAATTRRRSTAHAGFAELDGGQTLFVSFIEKKMGSNKFYECDRIDAEDRDAYDDEILGDTVNLDECLKILDYDQLEAIFLELDPQEQGTMREKKKKDEDEPVSKRKSSKRDEEEEEEDEKPSRKTAAKDDDDDDVPVRRRGAKKEEVEEEPEEKPTRRRGAKVEEEPEEEDEKPVRRKAAKVEEEEEKPTRRSKAAKVEEPEDDEDEPEEKPTRRGAKTVKSEEHTCWVKGGVFGKDCDTHLEDAPKPNCYDCPEETWKACKAAQMSKK